MISIIYYVSLTNRSSRKSSDWYSVVDNKRVLSLLQPEERFWSPLTKYIKIRQVKSFLGIRQYHVVYSSNQICTELPTNKGLLILSLKTNVTKKSTFKEKPDGLRFVNALTMFVVIRLSELAPSCNWMCHSNSRQSHDS